MNVLVRQSYCLGCGVFILFFLIIIKLLLFLLYLVRTSRKIFSKSVLIVLYSCFLYKRDHHNISPLCMVFVMGLYWNICQLKGLSCIPSFLRVYYYYYYYYYYKCILIILNYFYSFKLKLFYFPLMTKAKHMKIFSHVKLF